MKLMELLPQTLVQKVREVTRLLWVRVVIMGLMAFVTLGLTQIFDNLVPDELAETLSGQSADRLLDIIANAMLAATIFSITVMVTVDRASSSQFTPRVHRLIVQDRTTQNTLAVFIGAYVYALLAIILREMGIYGDERAFVLFWMTVLVLIVIVVYLVRWVLHLQGFGSLTDTTRQIEQVTSTQFRDRLSNPCLGANPLTQAPPDAAEPVLAPEGGYVQHIYPESLQEVAERHGVDVYLTRNIGSFVFINAPLLWIVKSDTPGEQAEEASDEDLQEALLKNIRVGDQRTFDQDPRFGMIVLGEVASKALSPGVNDPGTAINVIGRLGRILSLYVDETKQERDNALSNLWVPPLDPVDLLDDGFGALARDGATIIEVQQRLQVVLAGLMQHPDDGISKAARNAAELHLRRALAAIDFAPDADRVLSSAHADVAGAVKEGATAA